MHGFERKHIIRLFLIAAAAGAIGAAIVFLRSGPRQQLENVFGVAETAFMSDGKIAQSTDVTVRLDNGARVVVRLPPGIPYLPRTRIELSVHASGPETMRYYTYEFLGYRESETSLE